jgi:polyhydroxyalkanoate synthesis regulator phasin
LNDPSSNQYDGVHRTYNKAVEEKLDQFLERNNITSREMTPEQAKSFADEIKKSSDPRIRQLNLRIYMREIMRGFRLFRGRE